MTGWGGGGGGGGGERAHQHIFFIHIYILAFQALYCIALKKLMRYQLTLNSHKKTCRYKCCFKVITVESPNNVIMLLPFSEVLELLLTYSLSLLDLVVHDELWVFVRGKFLSLVVQMILAFFLDSRQRVWSSGCGKPLG